MQRKAFVLLSGGIDSSTALAIAHHEFPEVEGVSVDYGQRHAKEINYAMAQCKDWDAGHVILNLGHTLRGGMLTDPEQSIPDTTYDKIEGVSPTYVPFRNGSLLSAIAARAQRWVKEHEPPEHDPELAIIQTRPERREAAIFFGAHAEDAHNWAYPDCTPEFIGAMANAIYVGTYHAVRLHTPLMWMQKWEIVKAGHRLGVNFTNTWSCYVGGDLHCGRCPTCYARQQAFMKALLHDPTEYAVPRKAV